jgi:hypothetical protein
MSLLIEGKPMKDLLVRSTSGACFDEVPARCLHSISVKTTGKNSHNVVARGKNGLVLSERSQIQSFRS